MGVFEESYSKLNTAQKEAVDAIDGPLLVVAGPGTGKTQLLSLRVANILRKTDADPSSVLCLTFTNKAALNMRERLMQLTGGEARDVTIKTFHSFAAELMNLYPDYFWNGARLSTAPDTTQIEIIQDILSSLPLDNPLALRFAGNFTAGRDVKNALKYAKEAGLTPPQLASLLSANLAYLDIIEPQLVELLAKPLSAKNLNALKDTVAKLPNQGLSEHLEPLQDLGQVIKESLEQAVTLDEGTGKTKHTGKWKQRWVQSVDGNRGMFKERERNTWWLNLAGVYESYRSQLHARGYYDYSDMIVEVIAQLRQHPTLLAEVQERFLYVLIDEFQDTNAAQLQLAHLVADHPSVNGNPNLMAVGDDDQSIYKFNGAELSNMLSFKRSYPKTNIIVLTNNYRSSQAILNSSAKVIAQVSDRLVHHDTNITKNLVAKNEPTQPGRLVHLSYTTEEQELSDICARVVNEYQGGQHSIALLARDHASLQRMASLLRARDIPVRYERQNNILDHPLVRVIHDLASLTVAIAAGNTSLVNTLLARTLRAPMWNIPPETLWEVASHTYPTSSWLDYLVRSKDQQLHEIADWLLWLANESAHEPLPVLLEYIMGLRTSKFLTSPLRHFYLARDDYESKPVDTEYLEALSAVRLLRSLVQDFTRSPHASLSDFVQFVQLSIDTGEVIADESVFVSGNEPVELLTVHKAKGLEFDSVYIINAVDGNWKPNVGGRKCPANLPLQPAGDDMDDYARLMYVAVTRAKRSLTIASYREDVQAKEVLATPLVHEIVSLENVAPSDPVESIGILEEHLSWPRLNIQNELLNLRQQLENFSLSASALLDFLDVSRGGPTTFFERHLLRLPEATSASMAFGTAMHAALEYAQIAVNADALDIKKVVARFTDSLEEQNLPLHEQKRFTAHGKDVLTKLLDSDTFWIGKGGLPEQALTDVVIGDAKLKGTLDRIDQKDKHLVIVDYKTGKPLGSLTTRDQTKAVKAWRHRTQLVFYAMLIKNSGRFRPESIAGQMWYLEASTPKELIREYIPSDAEISELEQLVQIIWPKIISLNLPDITNYGSDITGIQTFIQDLLGKKI